MHVLAQRLCISLLSASCVRIADEHVRIPNKVPLRAKQIMSSAATLKHSAKNSSSSKTILTECRR